MDMPKVKDLLTEATNAAFDCGQFSLDSNDEDEQTYRTLVSKSEAARKRLLEFIEQSARPEERPKNQRIGSPALIARLRDCAKHKNGPPVLLDEAADWIELLEREWLDMRHDLDRAMANHNADLNASASSPQVPQK